MLESDDTCAASDDEPSVTDTEVTNTTASHLENRVEGVERSWSDVVSGRGATAGVTK